MREHQEKIPYLYIRERFRQMDIGSLIKNKLVSYDESRGFINLKMMGEDYQVHYQSGIVYKQYDKVTSYLLKTVLLRYLVNGKGTRPTGRYISYKEIKDGQVYYPNFYRRTVQRLAKLYDSQPDIFHSSYELKRQVMSMGDYSFAFEFLPDIFFMFIFYQGDAEFPASANILMDRNIEDYFNAEDLAVIPDIAIEYFVHKGTIPPDLGMYHF